jgi:hypothetical protein
VALCGDYEVNFILCKKNSISRVRSFYADRKMEKDINENVLKF